MKKTLTTTIAATITLLAIITLSVIYVPNKMNVQATTSDDTIGLDGVNAENLDELNPLLFGGNEDLTVDEPSAHAEQLSKPAGIINRVISFAFPLAGIILFLMIVVGGFEMMTGAASKKSLDQGKQRVTNAIIGFIVLFSVYWIAQLVEMILGISMFGT